MRYPKGPAYAFGTIVPSVNKVFEEEFRRTLPRDVAMHFSRAQYRFDTANPLENLIDDSSKAAEDLSHCDVDLGIFACTGASFLHGSKGNNELTAKLSAIIGAPVLTASTAVLEALKSVKAHSISLLTPYTESGTHREIRFLEENGFTVNNYHYMNVVNAKLESRVPYKETYEKALNINDEKSDTLLISCTNLYSWFLVPRLEKIIDKTVITSNQAIMFASLKELKHPMINPARYGRLFDTAGWNIP